jgi:hypothetical protein
MFGKPGKPYLSLTITASSIMELVSTLRLKWDWDPNSRGIHGMIYGHIVFRTI